MSKKNKYIVFKLSNDTIYFTINYNICFFNIYNIAGKIQFLGNTACFSYI